MTTMNAETGGVVQVAGSSSLTDWQLEQRAKRITASDVPAVLSLDEYRSAFDVWAEKTGKAARTPAGEAAAWGHRIEPGLIDWASEQLGEPVRRNQWRTGDHAFLGATLDAETNITKCPVDAKTVGIMNFKAINLAEWGEDGTDECPSRFLAQLHTQMIVTGATMSYLAVLLAGHGNRLYRVPRSEELVQIIEDEVGAFWNNHVLKDIPPPADARAIDVLKRIKRAPGLKISVPGELVTAYLDAKAQHKEWEEKKDAAQAALLAATRTDSGEYAEEIDSPAGSFTYRQNKASEKIDTKRLIEVHPTIAAQFVYEQPGARVLRVVKPKGGGK